MNSYQNIIDDFTERLQKILKNQVLLILVIGSSSSPKVIKNWSDIDVIIVLKKYSFSTLEKIKKLSNFYNVKIGATIYTKEEFLDLNIDPKTYYHLYLLKNNKIKLQFISKDIYLPSVSFNDIESVYHPYLLWRIHILKRQFLYDTLDKERMKNLYKMLYFIMKAVLILDHEFPRNYEETFSLFATKYNFEYFDYEKFIEYYLCDDLRYTSVVEYAKKFLLYIIERY